MTGTLYNSNLIFRPDGTLAPVHRKLKPTGAERVVWGDADRRVFPGRGHPVGTDGQPHLLGELYAAGTHGAV